MPTRRVLFLVINGVITPINARTYLGIYGVITPRAGFCRSFCSVFFFEQKLENSPVEWIPRPPVAIPNVRIGGLNGSPKSRTKSSGDVNGGSQIIPPQFRCDWMSRECIILVIKGGFFW